MSKWLATIFDDDLFDAKYKTAKSIIDKENERIILRSTKYPDKGYTEWIISGNSIIINKAKGSGIVSEKIYITHISDVKLGLRRGGHTGDLDISGDIPKLWFRGIIFNLADVFVAHATAAHIVSLRQEGNQNPLEANIDPTIIGMRNQLDNGELDEETMNTMRERGILDAIGFVAPDPKSAPAPETPAPQPASSVADELLKLKNLVDMGVLTQEEFEHKKKALLGM